MGVKICNLCQDNLALDLLRQKTLFGTTFEDENGESPCVECIEEGLAELSKVEENQ